jgi:hypothetical protein
LCLIAVKQNNNALKFIDRDKFEVEVEVEIRRKSCTG